MNLKRSPTLRTVNIVKFKRRSSSLEKGEEVLNEGIDVH